MPKKTHHNNKTKKAKLSSAVLKKIQKEQIRPKAKWEFLLKKSALWAMLALTILVGALSSAAAIFLIKTSDWELRSQMGQSGLRFLMHNLPYFWLALLLAFIALAIYNFRHTEKGYRYTNPKIAAASTATILIIGLIFSQLNFGKHTDDKMLEHLPFYKNLHHQKQLDRWSAPEEGRLAGHIQNTPEKNSETISITDLSNQEWTIHLPPPETQKSPSRQTQALKKGSLIKITGQQIDTQNFQAERIKAWDRNFRPGKTKPGRSKR